VKKNKETDEQIQTAEDKTVAKKNVNKVGSLLKEMRLQKGLRIPDISKKLCIRKIYIEAIEESNYEEIPPIPYGIGFIRSYANFLGLNSGNIVELYKEETNTNIDGDMYMLEAQEEANVPGRKYLLISLLAIVAVYAGWHFYNLNAEQSVVSETEVVVDVENKNTAPIVVEDYSVTPEEKEEVLVVNDEENLSNTQEAPVVNQVVVTDESFETEQPAEKIGDNKTEDVVIKIKEETWIEVKDKEKLYISKVLQAGDQYVVPEGGKGMIVSIGKVNGAEVYINGKLVQVARPNKKTNIALDPFLSQAH